MAERLEGREVLADKRRLWDLPDEDLRICFTEREFNAVDDLVQALEEAVKTQAVKVIALEAERDRLKKDNEFLHNRRGQLVIERDQYRDEAINKTLRLVNDRIDGLLRDEATQEPDTGEVNMPEWVETAIEELEGIATAIRSLSHDTGEKG